MSQDHRVPAEADAVFEGGGVKGIAFAGAIQAAEEAGIRTWKNVAGASAGAITACLLVCGYDSKMLLEELGKVRYSDFRDGGRVWWLKAGVYQLTHRGLVPGRYFGEWLSDLVARSPLAKETGEPNLRFEHVVRDDLPDNLTEEEHRRARYRLRVIASDVTSGRMLVLPDHIASFKKSRTGPDWKPDELSLVEAVRMSMSFPYLYDPVMLHGDDGQPHFIVDGGLLSNFPIWLFDARGTRPPARPTWGFRLHGGSTELEKLPYRTIGVPFWRLALAKAMFQAATEAWDRELMSRSVTARTVSIPTHDVATTDFSLSRERSDALFRWGYESTQRFFASDDVQTYLKAFEVRRANAADDRTAALASVIH